MDIHLYALCWNEEDMVSFFLTHYGDVVDRIFIHDDGSDDNSVRLLQAHPKVEVCRLDCGEQASLTDASRFLPFYNSAWKRSRHKADWVIVCSLDELFVHPRGLRRHLQTCRELGVNIVPSFGFEMVSWRLPAPGTDLAKDIRHGARSWPFNKTCAFNPDEVKEINFIQGRHLCLPEGNLRFSSRIEVQLLHYHYLGFLHFVSRYLEKKRRNPTDYRRGLVGILAKFLLAAFHARPIPYEH